jgi:hypothetical protein
MWADFRQNLTWELDFVQVGLVWCRAETGMGARCCELTRAARSRRQEALNSERAAAMFAKNPAIHIPEVVHALSSSRVLTME